MLMLKRRTEPRLGCDCSKKLKNEPPKPRRAARKTTTRGREASSRTAEDIFRRIGGGGEDLRHAACGAGQEAAGRRRSDRRSGNAWQKRNGRVTGRPRTTAVGEHAVSRPCAPGVRPRRSASAPPAACACR